MTCSGCINPVVKCGSFLGLSFVGLRPLWQIAVIHIYFGPAVAQLVEALRYNSEGRGFVFE